MEVMMVKLVKLWLLTAILASGALDIRAADDSLDFLNYREIVGSTSTPPTPASNGAALGGASSATPPVAAGSTATDSRRSTWESFQGLFKSVDALDKKIDGVAQAVGAVSPNASTQKLSTDKAPSFLSQHPTLKTSLIVGGVIVGTAFAAWSSFKIYHMTRAWLYDIENRLKLVSGTQVDNLSERRNYFKLHKMYATNSNWGGISSSSDHVLNSPASILTTDLVTLRRRLTEDLMNERIFVAGIDKNQNTADYCDVQELGKRLNRQGLTKIRNAIRLEQDQFLSDMQRLQKYFTLTPVVPATVAPATLATATATAEHRWGTNWAWSLASSSKTGLSALAGSARTSLSGLLRRKADDTVDGSATYEARLVALGIQIIDRQAVAGVGVAADAADGAAQPVATPLILVSLTGLQQDQIAPFKERFLLLVANNDTNNEYAKLYFDAAMAYVRLAALDKRIDDILQVVNGEAVPV